jgi:hypothetical protein
MKKAEAEAIAKSRCRRKALEGSTERVPNFFLGSGDFPNGAPELTATRLQPTKTNSRKD